MRRAVSLIAAFGCIGASAMIALAAGGGTQVSTAVPVQLGQTLSSSTDQGAGVNFFKIPAGYGDLVAVGFGVPSAFQSDPNRMGVGICLLPLGTDDFTLSRAPCLSNHDNFYPTATNTLAQVSYRILRAGTYTLAIGSDQCIDTGPTVKLPCSTVSGSTYPVVPYQLRVTDRVYTLLSLSAPSSAVVNSAFTVHGVLRGGNASRAKIAIRIRHAGNSKGGPVVRTSTNGQFKARISTTTSGRYIVSATYLGDAGHQASNASARVSVS